MTKQSDQILSVVNQLRLAMFEEHGAEGLTKLDSDSAIHLAPIVKLFDQSKDKSLSEDERTYNAVLGGIVALKASYLMALDQEN